MKSQLDEDKVGITAEDLQALKDGWLKDPYDGLENTEGFEAYRDELLAFQKEHIARWEENSRKSLEKRIKMMRKDTGISNLNPAMYLNTFDEIEMQIKSNHPDLEGSIEKMLVELAQAQARATLLLAAQVQRVADVLEEQIANAEIDAEREETRRLYKFD